MSEILIDRNLLQRILDAHLELEVEARAFRKMRNQFGIGNADRLLQFGQAHQEASREQRSQIEGIYRALREALDCQDDTAVLYRLSTLFPPR